MGGGCCGVEGWVKGAVEWKDGWRVLWSGRMGEGCCGVEGWVKGAVEWKDG